MSQLGDSPERENMIPEFVFAAEASGAGCLRNRERRSLFISGHLILLNKHMTSDIP